MSTPEDLEHGLFRCPYCGRSWSLDEWENNASRHLKGSVVRWCVPDGNDKHHLPADYALVVPPVVIAHFGRYNAGKSVAIAALALMVERSRRIGDWSAETVFVSENLDNYVRSLRDGGLPGGTSRNDGAGPADALLAIFRVWKEGSRHSERYLVVRDLSGEALEDEIRDQGRTHGEAAVASEAIRAFTSAIDGVVYCVDPDIHTTHTRGQPTLLPRIWDPGAPDVAEGADESLSLLLSICRVPAGARSGSTIPVAVTITKSDLIPLGFPSLRSVEEGSRRGRTAEIIQLGGGPWLRQIHHDFEQYDLHSISVTGAFTGSTPDPDQVRRGIDEAWRPVSWLLDRLVAR